MHILDLTPENPALIRQAATLLTVAFPGWREWEVALAEVEASLQPGRISRGALDDHGVLLGWVGGISQYNGHVWELHPLVVGQAHRRQGVGRALVLDLEVQVKSRGGITIILGTDDEYDQTSLSAVDLYPNLLGHIAGIRNLRDHPYEFYQKVGFVITGVIPDANGWGKPDILMAKRVA